MNEEWRWIEGFEGRYEISNKGRVRSFCRINGVRYSNLKEPTLIKPYLGKVGYWVVSLTDLSMKSKHRQLYLHRLLAKAFIPNPEGLPEINHKDLNKANCRLDNLEWVSHKDNIRHAARDGRLRPKNQARGERANKSGLTNDDVRAIRSAYRRGARPNQCDLAKQYSVSPSTISRIVLRQKWKHI